MDKQIELKPCPFCGGKALLESEIRYYKTYDTWYRRAKVKCSICKAETRLCLEFEDITAIKLWNRRVENG